MARPRFTPTNAEREAVKLMKSQGRSDSRIGAQLGISRTTLLKHFEQDLDEGADIQTERLLIYAERAARRGNASAIRWLAARRDRAAKGGAG